MKKWLSYLMVLVLALSCALPASGEEKAGSCTLSFTLGESVMELIRGELMDDAAADAVKAIVEKAALRVQADENTAYMEVLLNGTALCHIAVEMVDQDAVLTTSLLPGVAVRLPVEQQQNTDELEAMVQEDVAAWLGEGEKGSFVVEEISDTPFDTHYVINLNDPALGRMLEKWAEELAPDLGADLGVSTVVEEEEAISCELYTRENGEFLLLMRDGDALCTDVLCVYEGGSFVFALLPEQYSSASVARNVMTAMENDFDDGLLIMGEEAEDALQVLGTLYAGGAEVSLLYSHEKLQEQLFGSLVLEVTDGEMSVGVGGEFQNDAAGTRGSLSVLGLENDEVVTLHVEADHAARVIPADAYTTLYDVEQLMTDEELLDQLETMAMGAAAQMLIFAAAAMPDEVAVLTNYIVMLESDAIGIIGGADGPTTVFVATEEVEMTSAETEEAAEETVEETESEPTARPLFNK